MNLVIDIGNTLTKTALFAGSDLRSFSSFEKVSVDALKRVLEVNPDVKNVILSSVVEHDQAIADFLRSKYHFIELAHTTKIPLENLYGSPESLGKDRLAAGIGANLLFRAKDVLAVDAGTCIKYDFVNAM
jgi:type III pantothenate kinase